ncbi:MAG: hypothetical protein J07HQX50_01794 [Haloquadratum sp. J07HQX50]|nr:MAG: hypothetical protein J07HQX50_01794 [Haloquadratum sp. J07HQX50]
MPAQGFVWFVNRRFAWSIYVLFFCTTFTVVACDAAKTLRQAEQFESGVFTQHFRNVLHTYTSASIRCRIPYFWNRIARRLC